MKVRVYQLANELGMSSKALLQLLTSRGEFVRSASSTVEPPVVHALRSELVVDQRGRPSGGAQTPSAPAASTPESKRGQETPPSMAGGWHAGAVKVPVEPDLLKNIDKLGQRFPEFRRHRAALRSLGSQVVYASRCKEVGHETSGLVLVRFSGAIEAAFGLTREVLIFYSPFEDLQVRGYQAVQASLRNLPREVTPDIAFVSAPDPRLRTKLDDWSRPMFMGIPLELGMDEDPIAFISLIRDYIYSRDLFYETTPVRGDRFFGRRVLLQSLRDDVKQQRVAGLFGLRKAGKTSVLMQLSDNVSNPSLVTILLDLEAFPAPPEDPTPDILAELRRKLVYEFTERMLRTQELVDLVEPFTIAEFKTALQTLLRKVERDGVRVLLMMDEIEYLTPSDKVDISEGNMPQIAQLLGALRSLVQETDSFTFILSGLTSAIVENGRLYGRPNPLFSWAKSYYLAPFDRSEADELAMSVGGKMGIEIDEAALEALYEASGGHAFLYRNLSSTVVTTLPVDVYRRRIKRADVLRAFLPWRAGITGNVAEMILHVRRYYPTEATLLDILAESPSEFSNIADTEPLAVHHLVSLGMIRLDGQSYKRNSLLELM